MSVDTLKSQLPDYAKDLKLNLGALKTITTMTPAQLWGTALACALASRHAPTIQAIRDDAAQHLDEAHMTAAKAAAAIMGMNNIYYRFVHLVGDASYGQMRANLRMQVIGNPGIDKADFELFCLAVSAINGCGMCLESHEKVLRQAGVGSDRIQDAARIAAIIHAVAVALEGEAVLAQ